MDLNQYAFDEDLAENGRVVHLDKTSSLTICRWGNKKFLAMFSELMKPYGNARSQQFNRLEMDGSEQSEIMLQVVAKTVLVDWEGMTDDGKKLKYSPENAIRMFRKYDSFLGDVVKVAQEDANFKSDVMEEELGNSATDSEANSGSEETGKP